jgi:hypothetical protein
VTSNVVEKAEGAENVISLPAQEQRASGYAHFLPGNIPAAYSGNAAPLPDERARFRSSLPPASEKREPPNHPPVRH